MRFEFYGFWFLLNAFILVATRPTKKNMKFIWELTRPTFMPSGKVFFYAWLCLYILMSTSVCLIQNHNKNHEWSFEVILYVVFLGVSSMFTVTFFTLHQLWASTIVVFISWALSIIVTTYFFQSFLWAGWVFLAVPIWLTFALYLSFSISFNNPSSNRRISFSHNQSIKPHPQQQHQQLYSLVGDPSNTIVYK